MTPLEHVKNRIREDYGDRADHIIDLLDKHMAKLEDPDGRSEEEMQGAFQRLLMECLFPFLACLRALRDAGESFQDADHYASTLWNDLPEEMKKDIVRRDREIGLEAE